MDRAQFAEMSIPKPCPPARPAHRAGFAERCPSCRVEHGPPESGRPYSLDVAKHHYAMVIEEWHQRQLMIGGQQ